jgi:hypothetical protein
VGCLPQRCCGRHCLGRSTRTSTCGRRCCPKPLDRHEYCRSARGDRPGTNDMDRTGCPADILANFPAVPDRQGRLGRCPRSGPHRPSQRSATSVLRRRTVSACCSSCRPPNLSHCRRTGVPWDSCVATSCGGILGGFLEDQTAANERIAALEVSVSPPTGESVTGEGRGRRPFKISGQACAPSSRSTRNLKHSRAVAERELGTWHPTLEPRQRHRLETIGAARPVFRIGAAQIESVVNCGDCEARLRQSDAVRLGWRIGS